MNPHHNSLIHSSSSSSNINNNSNNVQSHCQYSYHNSNSSNNSSLAQQNPSSYGAYTPFFHQQQPQLHSESILNNNTHSNGYYDYGTTNSGHEGFYGNNGANNSGFYSNNNTNSSYEFPSYGSHSVPISSGEYFESSPGPQRPSSASPYINSNVAEFHTHSGHLQGGSLQQQQHVFRRNSIESFTGPSSHSDHYAKYVPNTYSRYVKREQVESCDWSNSSSHHHHPHHTPHPNIPHTPHHDYFYEYGDETFVPKSSCSYEQERKFKTYESTVNTSTSTPCTNSTNSPEELSLVPKSAPHVPVPESRSRSSSKELTKTESESESLTKTTNKCGEEAKNNTSEVFVESELSNSSLTLFESIALNSFEESVDKSYDETSSRVETSNNEVASESGTSILDNNLEDGRREGEGGCDLEDEKGAEILVDVPVGWRREVRSSPLSVIYYSPSETKLKNLDEVERYVTSDGTCKCGLSCPFKLPEVFSFDPKVKNGNVGLVGGCSHVRSKRKSEQFSSAEESPLISSTRDDLGDGRDSYGAPAAKKRRNGGVGSGAKKEKSKGEEMGADEGLKGSSSNKETGDVLLQMPTKGQSPVVTSVTVPFAQQSPDTTTQTPQRDLSPASSVSSERSSSSHSPTLPSSLISSPQSSSVSLSSHPPLPPPPHTPKPHHLISLKSPLKKAKEINKGRGEENSAPSHQNTSNIPITLLSHSTPSSIGGTNPTIVNVNNLLGTNSSNANNLLVANLPSSATNNLGASSSNGNASNIIATSSSHISPSNILTANLSNGNASSILASNANLSSGGSSSSILATTPPNSTVSTNVLGSNLSTTITTTSVSSSGTTNNTLPPPLFSPQSNSSGEHGNGSSTTSYVLPNFQLANLLPLTFSLPPVVEEERKRDEKAERGEKTPSEVNEKEEVEKSESDENRKESNSSSESEKNESKEVTLLPLFNNGAPTTTGGNMVLQQSGGNQLILQQGAGDQRYPIFQTTLAPLFQPPLILNGGDGQGFIQIEGQGPEMMVVGEGKKKKKRVSKKQQQQAAQLQLQQQILLQQLFNHQQQQVAQQQLPFLLPGFSLQPMSMNMNFFPQPTILTLPNLILNPADGTLFIQQQQQHGGQQAQQQQSRVFTPKNGGSGEMVDDAGRQNATPDSSTSEICNSATTSTGLSSSSKMTVSLPLGSSTNLQSGKKLKSKAVSSSTVGSHKRILPQQKQILPKIDSTTSSSSENNL